MKISDDLTALVFELERARSPVEKGRAIARAWRTVRGLSATERRLLAREVGFDGAEDLVEGLAGKGGGSFAPAAVLEALGRMRQDESFSVRGILAGLRDPESRDDLLVRGLDLMANSLEIPEDENEPQEWTDGTEDLEIPVPAAAMVAPSDRDPSDDTEPKDDEAAEKPTLSPPPGSVETPAPKVVTEEPREVEPEAVPMTAPTAVEVGPSSWDEMWGEPQPMVTALFDDHRRTNAREPHRRSEHRQVKGTVLSRLREFREAIPELENATNSAIREAVNGLPEAWARRRALVALIEAEVPDDIARTLDLIDDLERRVDRRWCLSALARRGDLAGADLERALGMITSPAARRRVGALARGA